MLALCEAQKKPLAHTNRPNAHLRRHRPGRGRERQGHLQEGGGPQRHGRRGRGAPGARPPWVALALWAVEAAQALPLVAAATRAGGLLGAAPWGGATLVGRLPQVQ